MKIYIGSDHAGYKMKELLKEYLSNLGGHEVEDKGAFSYDPTDDYPDFVTPVAKSVAEDLKDGNLSRASRGITMSSYENRRFQY